MQFHFGWKLVHWIHLLHTTGPGPVVEGIFAREAAAAVGFGWGAAGSELCMFHDPSLWPIFSLETCSGTSSRSNSSLVNCCLRRPPTRPLPIFPRRCKWWRILIASP